MFYFYYLLALVLGVLLTAFLVVATVLCFFLLCHPAALDQCLRNGFAGTQNVGGHKWEFVCDVVTRGIGRR